jgi:hypothetical protein
MVSPLCAAATAGAIWLYVHPLGQTWSVAADDSLADTAKTYTDIAAATSAPTRTATVGARRPARLRRMLISFASRSAVDPLDGGRVDDAPTLRASASPRNRADPQRTQGLP